MNLIAARRHLTTKVLRKVLRVVIEGSAKNAHATTVRDHWEERRVPATRPKASPLNAPGRDLHFGILSISGAPEDHSVLRSILNDSRWRIVKSRTCKEAVARLCRSYMPVVICASHLPDGTWRDVLDQINALARPPVLIVTSRLADDYLWAEVLNLGGYNVLAKPFRESEVKHMVASLWMQEHPHAPQTAVAGAA